MPPRRSGLLRLSAAYFYLDFPHRFGRSARERPGPPNGTDMSHRSRSLSLRRMCTTLTYSVRLDFRRAWPLNPWVSQEDGLQSVRLLIPPGSAPVQCPTVGAGLYPPRIGPRGLEHHADRPLPQLVFPMPPVACPFRSMERRFRDHEDHRSKYLLCTVS